MAGFDHSVPGGKNDLYKMELFTGNKPRFYIPAGIRDCFCTGKWGKGIYFLHLTFVI